MLNNNFKLIIELNLLKQKYQKERDASNCCAKMNVNNPIRDKVIS